MFDSFEKIALDAVAALQLRELEVESLRTRVSELEAEVVKTKNIAIEAFHNVEQTLGKALGYPWFKDDQQNFPGATEEHGVCVGEHVAETIAIEAANRIKELEAALEDIKHMAGSHTVALQNRDQYGFGAIYDIAAEALRKK